MPKYSYRKKQDFRRSQQDTTWLPCTIEQRKKLEKMSNKFEFKENKEPNPTPNAIENKESK